VRGLLVAVALLCSLSTAAAQPDGGSPAPSATAQYVHAHRAVSTKNPAAQEAFDDGLTLLYAFNPEEARSAFRRAAADDPDLALAYWGIALSFGVNINTPYDPEAQRKGRDALALARAHETGASDVERALIEAAAKRYALAGRGDAERSAAAFRDAMMGVAAAFPDDDDVLTIAAESAMDTRPWAQWTDEGKPAPGTDRIVALLKIVLARDPRHIGANHYLLHALEASPHPEDALDAARRLAADSFEPAAEHLTHMPAHIFMRTGEYDAAAQSNLRAVAAFRDYLDGSHEAGHETYFGHDCRFAVDAFMMAGEYASSRRAAALCKSQAVVLGAYAAVRFRRWSDLGSFASGSTFAHGMAAVATGHGNDALRDAVTLESEKTDVSRIAAHVIRARVAAASGQRDSEIEQYVRAVAIQDRMGYSEPPEWFFPVRESLGAAYYLASRYDDAERTFRDDLARNARNPRSLFGLARTLEHEARTADAASADKSFSFAWAHADVRLTMEDL
jgi:tetratricopeptide (TPR) repeat protein